MTRAPHHVTVARFGQKLGEPRMIAALVTTETLAGQAVVVID